MHRAHILFLIAILAPACVSISESGPDENPRLGDMGRVIFNGGGGCNSSTTLALGSTATLTLEPQDGELPSDLRFGSLSPDVVNVSVGESGGEIVLQARSVGETYIELLSGGDVWDGLAFSAEPALSASFSAPDVVLAGGTLRFQVEEIYGACGTECPLIGSDFMAWDGGSALTLIQDVDRLAFFHVDGSPGVVDLRGFEPSAGSMLIEHRVEIVDPEEAGELDGTLFALLPDGGDESATATYPLTSEPELAVGAMFQPVLFLTRSDERDIPLTSFEADWTILSGAELIEPSREELYIDGPVFAVTGVGQVVLHVEIPLIGTSRDFTLTLVDIVAGE